MKTGKFSERAKQELKFYVYALIDPRNNEVFYIGKGTNNRVFEHEKNNSIADEKKKDKRINDIINSGNTVKKLIISHGLTEDKAYAAEAAMINLFNYVNSKKLTNIVQGHHSDPAMTVEEIEHKYAEKLNREDIHHNLLIVKINSLYHYGMTDEEIMECVRGHWVISEKSAKKVDYLVAVYHGLIVGIYEGMKWYSSGEKTSFYPRYDEENIQLKNRKYCTCTSLQEYSFAYEKYMHKDISDIVGEVQNPISYIWGRKNVVNVLQDYYDGFVNGFENPLIFKEKFGDDMMRMGFEMDAWERYKKSGNTEEFLTSNNYSLIKEAVGELDFLTATALLFSQWRYLTHWAYLGCGMYDGDNDAFFKAVIERITALAIL